VTSASAPVRKVAFAANGQVVLDCGHTTASRQGHPGGGWSPMFVAELVCVQCDMRSSETLVVLKMRRGQGLPCTSCGLRQWNGWRQAHASNCPEREKVSA
jgi:hypothetical protein